MEDDLTLLVNGRRPQNFAEWNTTSIILIIFIEAFNTLEIYVSHEKINQQVGAELCQAQTQLV